MAATCQVFDEARHFYVMRDYLLELDVRAARRSTATRTPC